MDVPNEQERDTDSDRDRDWQQNSLPTCKPNIMQNSIQNVFIPVKPWFTVATYIFHLYSSFCLG